jgi:SAM-dependent methyltransferase
MSKLSPSTADLSTKTEDYSEAYYRSGLGPPYNEDEPHWVTFFGAVAQQIIRHVGPSTVLDVGCAKGFLVDALVKRGVDATGIDISEYAISAAPAHIRDRVSVHDLTVPLTGRWDLICCIETAEHLSPLHAQEAIDNITSATNAVLFSSTPHDFVEATHINVHPVADWAEWFALRGFYRRTDIDITGLSPWAVLFERQSLTAPGVVRLYESELAPLREEVEVKRQKLLETQRELDKLSGIDDLPRPVGTQIDTSIDRVLTLTDMVIGLQAELAEARYQYDLLNLQIMPRNGSRFSDTEHLDNAVQRTRLYTEIELRQAMTAKLAEQTKRADEAEARLAAMEASRAWKLGTTAATAARLVRGRRR